MQLNLLPHPATPPSDPEMKVWATVDHAGALGATATTNIWFGVGAPAERFVIPELAEPERAEDLWQATCFEAFLRVDGEASYRGTYANYGVKDKPVYPRAEHPVIRTHPVTKKKALFVNSGFTRYITGIPRDESDGILRYLYEHAANPLFQCRFRWRENSIAFWDNRCVQHHAMWDYWPHTRLGNRVTVKGDRPV